MSTHLTVRQLGQVAAEHHATLASLPATLRLIESGVPDIALVGSGKAAIDEALALSPKAIVIADPTAIDAAVSQKLLQASCLVIPAMTLGANLSQINREETPEKIGLIHSRYTSQGDMKAAIFEHLVGLANVVNGLTDLTLLSVVSNGYVASAKNADGVEVTWSGLAGVASAYYELDMVGLSDRLDVRIDLDGSARPLMIRRANASGSIQPIGSYESGRRRFWRGVADSLRTGAPVMQWKDIVNLHALAESFVHQASPPNRASA
jgi:hypothetical protein